MTSSGWDASLAEPNGIGTHTRKTRSNTNSPSSATFRIHPL
jgi:hypothetical protein